MVSGWKMIFLSILLGVLGVTLMFVNLGNVPLVGDVQKHLGGWLIAICLFAGLAVAGTAIVAAEERGVVMILTALLVGALHAILLAGLIPKISQAG